MAIYLIAVTIRPRRSNRGRPALFKALSRRDRVMVLTRHPHFDPDTVTVITDHGAAAATTDPSLAGFGWGELLPHTAASAVAEPPGLLVLVCVRPATTGGLATSNQQTFAGGSWPPLAT